MINLSKTRYCTGLRCPKILWMDANKSEEKDLSGINQSRLDTGIRVGELARAYFGPYTLVPYDTKELQNDEEYSLILKNMQELKNQHESPSKYSLTSEETAQYLEVSEERIRRIKEKAYRRLQLVQTERLLKEITQGGQRPSVICEASFANEDGFCSVDILRCFNDYAEIIEVKSSVSLKDEHLDDMAYQCYILGACDLNIKKVSLMHINSDYERSGKAPLAGDPDIQKFFTLVDCTKEVKEKQKEISANIKRIKEIAGDETEPAIHVGKQCDNPYPCVYKKYCFRHITKTSPIDIDTSPTVDKAAINTFLETLSYPLYFLDFETFQQAIPSFDSQHPYQQIPSQYSLHIQTEEGAEPLHREFLAEAGSDPRRAVAERLCADIPKDVCVLAYWMPFEKGIIEGLAALFPDLAPHLMAIHDNIKDLIVPFRKLAWRSPAQEGSNSIKAVLPAMFPDDSELDYHSLELIHNGGEAMNAFADLPNKSPEEQKCIRAALLSYCRLDTLAMVKILEKLYEAVKS